MVCDHLKELYRLCEDQQIRLGGADLIRVVCLQCDQHDVCPSVLIDEYDRTHPDPDDPPASPKPPVSGVRPA